MKITKIFVLLLTLTLVFSLVSCKKDRDDESPDTSDGSIENPDNSSESGDNADGDATDGTPSTPNTPTDDVTNTDNTASTPDNSDENDSSTQGYIYSINGDRFHLPNCYHIGSIKEESKRVHTGAVDELVTLGYTPCLTCMPDESGDSEEEIIPEGTTFIINKETKKIHKIDCHSAKTIKKENRIYTQKSYVELLLLDEGYTPCENCDP